MKKRNLIVLLITSIVSIASVSAQVYQDPSAAVEDRVNDLLSKMTTVEKIDYIGGYKGNMYGYVKDSNNPMKSFIAPKTKLDNLYLTGQSINMHGVLGVTIGAVVTCSEIVGKEYLVNKINQSLE